MKSWALFRRSMKKNGKTIYELYQERSYAEPDINHALKKLKLLTINGWTVRTRMKAIRT